MTFGALSKEAHEALALAMNKLGTRSNTGEGGEDNERFHATVDGISLSSKTKQVASGRFGVTTEYLVNAEEIQIGQNTNGAVFYFNPHAVVLPYSGGWLTLPTAVNRTKNFDYDNFKGEGFGWFPDYWSSNQNIANTLVNLTGDNQLQETLKGLEKGQL